MQLLPTSPKLAAVREVARNRDYEVGHSEQVSRLAGELFDTFAELHGLGPSERDLLVCAGLVHDLGIMVDYAKHHKHSFRLIMQSDFPTLTQREKEVVANLARYHRKAEPDTRHTTFADLAESDREIIRRLAALLRLADGLDRAHDSAVRSVTAEPSNLGHWSLKVRGTGDLGIAVWGAVRKAELFQKVFGVQLTITVCETGCRVEKDSPTGRK